jgi:hypothetical protein
MEYISKTYTGSANTWDAVINGTNVGSAERLGHTSNNIEAGLEMTDTNIWNSGQTAYAENLGTQGLWWSGWEASGSGNYVKPETAGPESNAPTCALALPSTPHGDMYFGAQPCGNNGGTEPSALTAPTTLSTTPIFGNMLAGGSEITPAEVRSIAVAWSAREGDANPASISTTQASQSRAMQVALPGWKPSANPGAEQSAWLDADAIVVELHGGSMQMRPFRLDTRTRREPF